MNHDDKKSNDINKDKTEEKQPQEPVKAVEVVKVEEVSSIENIEIKAVEGKAINSKKRRGRPIK